MTTSKSDESDNKPGVCISGCGWLGTPLALHLLKSGHKVWGTTTSPQKLRDLSSKGIDVSLYVLGEKLARFPDADVFVINIPPSRIGGYADKLSSLLRQIPESARQIIYCSTTSVYADVQGVAKEQDVVPGMGLSKNTEDEAKHGTPRSELIRAEGVMFADSRTTIVRLAGLIGGDRHPVKYLSGRTGLKAPGAPVNITSLNDAISGIRKLIEMGTTGEIFNLCASEHPTRREYYTNAARKAGLPLPLFDQTDTSGGKLIDNNKIEKHTGMRFRQI